MTAQLDPGPSPRAATRDRTLAATLTALALAMMTTSLVGPLGLGLMRYRTSATTLNQLLGSDAAALLSGAPLALAAAVLALRRHQLAPPLAAGVSGYAVYTYAQVVIGQEYLRLPGNVERFFPLLLAVFLLAEVTLVLSWRALTPHPPAPSRRLTRVAAATLFTSAGFLLFGLHLPTMVAAWSEPSSVTQYASSPTPFWMVKLMDLAIVVPATVAVGVGMLRRAVWAQRVAYPLFIWLTCLGMSVTMMAVVMLVRGDPDASPPLAVGFTVVTVALGGLTAAFHRPLVVSRRAAGALRANPSGDLIAACRPREPQPAACARHKTAYRRRDPSYGQRPRYAGFRTVRRYERRAVRVSGPPAAGRTAHIPAL